MWRHEHEQSTFGLFAWASLEHDHFRSIIAILLILGAHVQRYLVCVFVFVLMTTLQLQATKLLVTNIISLNMTNTRKIDGHFPEATAFLLEKLAVLLSMLHGAANQSVVCMRGVSIALTTICIFCKSSKL